MKEGRKEGSKPLEPVYHCFIAECKLSVSVASAISQI